uniref:SCP domain-containing protein n=1 Tax=Ascaris lumbricoides TaxID=6252 RepID=A0A0M3HFS6_ASCLU
MEQRAQDWADRCKYGHSTYEYRNQAGENIYMWMIDRHESIDTNTLKATQLWWDEIELINMTSPEDYKMNEKIIATAGHWSQQAWGATTKIGCGVANCTDPPWYVTHVVCHYFVAGNYLDKPIFELGNGCSKDSDCTTYEKSTCNTSTKLCM